MQDQVAGAIEDHWEESEDLFRKMDSPEDSQDLLVLLGNLSPVEGINHFHWINPNFNLRDIPHQEPLKVLEAVLRITCLSDRWLTGQA